MLHNFNGKTSPVFENTVPICAHKQLFDGWWVIPNIMWLWWIPDKRQNRCPLPSTDLLSGHRASTLPWDLSPFKVNSLQITQGQTFCLFQNKSFWIFKRGLLLSDFCDNFFPRPPRHKNDEFMIILAGVKKAESFVKRGKWQPIDDNHLMLDLRQGQDMWI